MDYLFFVIWLIGVHFASTGNSLVIKHGYKIKEQLNTNTMGQERISEEESQEKSLSEQLKETDYDDQLHSNNEYFQMDDGNSTYDNDRYQPTLNMKMGGSEEKRLDILDEEGRHINHTKNNYNQLFTQNYEEMQHNSLVVDNEEYGELHNLDTFSGESIDLFQNNQQTMSSEQQNEDSQSEGSSADYESILIKTQSEELYENDKEEYLGELYDDEELKYIFNITQLNKESWSKSKRETDGESEELKEESPQDALYLRSAAAKNYVDKDTDDDYNNKEKYENNDTKEKTPFGDINMLHQIEEEIPKVTTQGDHQTKDEKIPSDAKQHTNKTRESDTTENISEKEELNLDLYYPSTNTMDNNTNTQYNTDGQTGYIEHALNSSLNTADEIPHQGNISELITDPCIHFQCKRGKICEINEDGIPICVCQDPSTCLPTNVNDHVCGTDNNTYESPCHLFGTKCKLEGTKQGNHLHLDYQGPCKYIPPCSDYELIHFPFRMRDWLKNVLIQLYERDLENPGILSEKQRIKVKKSYENDKRLQEGDHHVDLLIKDFEKNYHMYVYPVHWQFSQLDKHSTDRLLTRSELAALRAPLIPMEHCVTAFFQACNANKDKHISLREWCYCFGIREEDIDENLLF